VFAATALGAVFTGIWLFALPVAGFLWAVVFAWTQRALDIDSVILLAHYRAGFIDLTAPWPTFSAPLPADATWGITAVATGALLALTLLMPRDRLPLIYLTRAIAFVQTSALVYFALWPGAFPYHLGEYIRSMLIAGIFVIALVPIALAFTYYIVDVGFWKKAGLTLLIMGHLFVFLPLQYAVHAVILRTFSLLFMPVLLIFFGLLLDVTIFIALYGWGMSWRPREPPLPKAPLRRKTAVIGICLLGACFARPAHAEPVIEFVLTQQIDTTQSTTLFGVRVRHTRAPIGTPLHAPGRLSDRPIARVMLYALFVIVAIISLYGVRHYRFTLNRLAGRQRHPYSDIDAALWPPVTILIPAHNEELVLAGVLKALLDVDYPREQLEIIVTNDRSTDRTAEILDDFAARYPLRIHARHRREGVPGKAAVLRDATGEALHDILLVFDADYLPGRGLIKQLVAPFFDPEVGAVMGRVVPHNMGERLLTRLLDLERAAGYQVDQQARMNLNLVPQYGGTVGGVRRRALQAVGGWNVDALTEDTDLTFRLLVAGWQTVYQNRSECYEQVPESWRIRVGQLLRWAAGHNDVARRAARPLLQSGLPWRQRVDGLLLLGVYVMPPLTLIGWVLTILLFYAGIAYGGIIAILAVASYSTFGNFAVFFEIAVAARLDRAYGQARILPIIVVGFLVNLVTATRGLHGLRRRNRRKPLTWTKTVRHRRSHST